MIAAIFGEMVVCQAIVVSTQNGDVLGFISVYRFNARAL
jgi:hypothetical protein